MNWAEQRVKHCSGRVRGNSAVAVRSRIRKLRRKESQQMKAKMAPRQGRRKDSLVPLALYVGTLAEKLICKIHYKMHAKTTL